MGANREGWENGPIVVVGPVAWPLPNAGPGRRGRSTTHGTASRASDGLGSGRCRGERAWTGGKRAWRVRGVEGWERTGKGGSDREGLGGGAGVAGGSCRGSLHNAWCGRVAAPQSMAPLHTLPMAWGSVDGLGSESGGGGSYPGGLGRREGWDGWGWGWGCGWWLVSKAAPQRMAPLRGCSTTHGTAPHASDGLGGGLCVGERAPCVGERAPCVGERAPCIGERASRLGERVPVPWGAGRGTRGRRPWLECAAGGLSLGSGSCPRGQGAKWRWVGWMRGARCGNAFVRLAE